MKRSAIALGLVLAVLAAGSAQAATATKVHGLSPYPNPGACHGAPQSGTLFVNSEVEPWVGDNTIPGPGADADALIGTWQQDRFSSGGSSGLLVSNSEDGGASWTEPVTLIDDANPHVFNDKNSLTADPNDSDLVYAVWDRLVFPNERTQGEAFEHAAAFYGPTYFSKTENGTDNDGGDWTTRKILDLGRNDQTIANQIDVLPGTAGQTESTLVNVFDWIHNDNKSGR